MSPISLRTSRGRLSRGVSGLLFLLLLAALASRAEARYVSGSVEVIDGDSLRVDGVVVRLHGLDAPELGQQCLDLAGTSWRCGEAAREALERFIDERPVACRRAVFHGRFIGDCKVAGERISPWMLSEGWAVVDRRGARRYIGYESEARKAKRNLWAGEFEMPWEWREESGSGASGVNLFQFGARSIDQ